MLTATSTKCTAAWLLLLDTFIDRRLPYVPSTHTHTHTHTDICVRVPLCPTVATTAQRKCRSVSHGRSRCPMTFEIQSAAPSSDGNHKPSVAISFPTLHTTPPPPPYNVCAHSCMYPAAELASLLQCPLGWTRGEQERQKERESEKERGKGRFILHTPAQ